MSSKASRSRKVKPKMLIHETLYRTKKVFHKTFMNVKSCISWGPKPPTTNPTFSCNSKIHSRLQEFDNFCRSLSERWDSIEAVKTKDGHLSPKGQDEQYNKSSIRVAECSGLNGSKEDKASRHSGRRRDNPSCLAADALAKKMKELAMMDGKDMDHVLDIEEVLHYYSRLTCPAYVEIVDKLFMNVYSEVHRPLPLPQSSRSVNNSMRKLGSASIHSSRRSHGPLKL